MIEKFLAKLSARERIAITVAAFILSIVFLDRLILGPVVDRIHMLNQKIQEKERMLKANMKVLANEKRVSNEIKLYDKYSLRALPSEEELASILGEIESMAVDADVYLIDASPEGDKEDGLTKIYLVKVDCEGTMDNIFNFLHAIESSRKLMAIQNLKIHPKAEGEENITANLSVAKITISE